MRKLLSCILLLFSTSIILAGDLGSPIPIPTIEFNTPIPTPSSEVAPEPKEKTTLKFDACCKVSCGQNLWASGTAIKSPTKGKTLILTAKHVTANNETPTIWCCGKQYSSKYVAYHRYCDVSMVEVDAELPTLELANSEPTKDTEFTLKACWVRGDFNTPRKGKVNWYGDWNGPEVTGGNQRVMYCVIEAGPGDSGGGLIDNNGKIIGLVSGAGPDNTMAAQTLTSIKELLKALEDARKPKTSPPPQVLIQNQFPIQCIGNS